MMMNVVGDGMRGGGRGRVRRGACAALTVVILMIMMGKESVVAMILVGGEGAIETMLQMRG